MPTKSFSCYLIGSESLLVQCAEILRASHHTIRGVVSDAPQVCEWASANSIPVISPDDNYAHVFAQEPFEYLLSITNLRIIPEPVLALPTRGTVNFHDGQLPDYSGLNVTTWALADGADRHGISWHIVETGIDTGNVLVERSFAVSDGETAFSLNTKCFEAGIESFPELLHLLEASDLSGRPQRIDAGRYFGKFHQPAHFGFLKFDESSQEVIRTVRSLDFGPYDNTVGTAKLLINGKLVVCGQASEGHDSSLAPGTVVSRTPDSLTVATKSSDVTLSRLVTLDGAGEWQSLDPSTVVFDGDVIVSPSPALLTDIGAVATQVARNGARAVEVLSDPQPVVIPDSLIANAQDFVTRDIHVGGATPERTAAIVGAFLCKFGDQKHADVSVFSDAAAVPESAKVVVRDGSPVRLTIADVSLPVDAVLSTLAKRLSSYRTVSGYPIDLAHRFRSLASPSAVESVRILFSDDASSHAGSYAATFIVRSNGQVTLVTQHEGLANVLATHLQAFANEAASKGSAPFRDIRIVPTEAYDVLVRDWNQTQLDYEPTSIPSMFRRAASERPTDTALVTTTGRLTYAELDDQSNQLANCLTSRGVRRGDRVGLCTDRSTDMMIGVLGVLKAGATYVPLDPDFPKDRLKYIAKDAAVADLVCQQQYAALFSAYSDKMLIIDDGTWRSSVTTFVDPSIEPDDLAYVIHTSGSTGNPKGVMVRHRNVANFFAAMDDVLQYDKPGTWLAVTSLSFDISVLELLWTLTRGFKVVIGSPVKPTRETASVGASSGSIDFSLFFFAASSSEIDSQRDQYELLLESAKFADQHGFIAIWSPERHFHAFGGLYPNPSVTNAALATITNNIRLRAGSLVSPLHSPIRIAEDWAMVDNLSNGRVDISFAAGWQPNDFVLQPQNFERRKEIMFEQIDTVQRLWGGESIEFAKADGTMVPVRTLPRPIQKSLPVWITAAGNPETFTMAAENGYNVLTHLLGQSVDELAEKIRLYREAERKAGQSGGKITLMLHTYIGESVDSVRELVREPMKAYLATAMNLVKEAAWSFPTFKEMTITDEGRFSMEHLSADDQNAILDFAFERYFETGGLFGSVESCAPFVEKLKSIGVAEIGCLVDFGVDKQAVLNSLPELARLLNESNRQVVDDPGSSGDGMQSASVTVSVNEEPRSMYSLALDEGVTHMQCTPSMARMLVVDDEGSSVLNRLDHFLVGGEALDADLAQTIKKKVSGQVTNMYGPTETTVWSTSYRVDGTDEVMPIGRPIGNNYTYILGRDGTVLPQGVTGELYIGGEGVTAGYLNRPDLTDERFVPDPFAAKEGLMYRTGDLCRYRPDGTIDFIGRNDHQVKVRGYRIELSEIEKAIRAVAAAREVAVNVEDRSGDPTIVAYLLESAGVPLSIDDIRTGLESILPPYMVPSQFRILSQFPRTPNGKLDRKALASQAPKRMESEVPRQSVAPASDLEGTIAKIWTSVLGTDDISVTDNFFDIGGHSLLAVQVNARLSEALGESFSLIDIFRFPTVRSFASYLSDRQNGGEEKAVATGSSRAEARRRAMNRRGR